MTSPAQILASRRNGRAGTGPGSAAGKARASRNARRHGFTLPVAAEPALAREVVDVADDIVRSVGARAGDPATHALACRIAEAMIDLRRIRLAKLPLLAALHAAPTRTRRTLRALARLDRYERHALWRRRTAVRAFATAAAEQNQRRNASDFNTRPHPSTTSRTGCVPPRDRIGSPDLSPTPQQAPRE